MLNEREILKTPDIGDKHTSAGIYSKLTVPVDIVFKIFDYVKKRNYELYVIDEFMFLTGTRIEATLNARLENIKEGDRVWSITIYDKDDAKKYGDEGQEWKKFLPDALFEEIKRLTGYPKNAFGDVFSLTADECSSINKDAICEVYPDLFKQYPDFSDWNLFWRHLFGRYCLKVTGWNYDVVAVMGGWDVKSLKEYYGKAPIEEVRKWDSKLISQLTTSDVRLDASTVLDIGCGNGCNMIFPTSIGVDIDERDLERAREKGDVILGDARYLPIKDRCVDQSMLCYVLNVVEEPLKVLNEAVRVSRWKPFIEILGFDELQGELQA